MLRGFATINYWADDLEAARAAALLPRLAAGRRGGRPYDPGR